MPKANEVATELRKLADALDRNPNAEVPHPYMGFGMSYNAGDKERFLAIAAVLPRPLKKVYRDNEFRLEYESPTISVAARIDRQKVCELIEPAKPAVYRCDLILSEAEESLLEVS